MVMEVQQNILLKNRREDHTLFDILNPSRHMRSVAEVGDETNLCRNMVICMTCSRIRTAPGSGPDDPRRGARTSFENSDSAELPAKSGT
jgi:hypothetical protein